MSSDRSQRLSAKELAKLNRQFDQQLEDLRKNTSGTGPSLSHTHRWAKLFLFSLFLISGLIAPFVVLIRTSIHLYADFQLNGWIALSAGVLATVILLTAYVLFLAFRYNQQWHTNKYIRRGIALLVAAYTLYGLLYYSGMNTKTEQVRSYYRTLHPIMRVALSTATFADSDIVVTDIRRRPADYAAMGLPRNPQSLHYVQSNGYVHAVDLRTKHRAEWKNWLMETGMNVMGLQTLRHVGTEDHLHVYLPLND